MLHVLTSLRGRTLADVEPHAHATVAEARECQWLSWDAESEVEAEGAWLRAAEYSPRVADEDAWEAARADALGVGLAF